ncbi:Hydrogenase isoenzymes formation protein HypE [Pontiella desulfatans]|uniref:Hydrogenase isoenzymes formation protein HypE n=1 Tax=Pontiella desulfatans TaxID=2750659 RepID=A0A6C2U451_PONDE|nr:hydrogenase expression/formation protein HypE [Pontiella desulfatans]VGO14663.1 Hydrogenase isoenzymes formation protein HypE [Pontiella desulfatans]
MPDKILLGHGSGGRMTRELVRDLFCRQLGDVAPDSMDDGAILSADGKIVFTTDSYVVSPLEFPGGDIGTLAVCGTVNDVAVMGARPLWLSLGVILEAGIELDLLERIVRSIATKAREAGVKIVCGDTKVVEKGKGDGIFINTSGIGVLEHPLVPETIEPGDKIIVTGTVGDHGMALLTMRKGFPLKSDLKSDCAPLNHMLAAAQEGADVKWMRDATRGGVATVLNELAENRPWGVLLQENDIPLSDAVAGVSELLGLDPLYSANEGKAVLVVSASAAAAVLDVLKQSPYGRDAAVVGSIVADYPGKTVLNTEMGTLRTLGILASDPLPRIC